MKRSTVLLAALLVGACSETPTTPRGTTQPPSTRAPSASSFDVTPGNQLLTNGSFESPVIPAGNPNPWTTYTSTGQGLTGWTVVSGSVDVQSGEVGHPFTGVPNGTQVLDLNNASISQSVGTTAGVTYRVSFSLSENYTILSGAPVNVTVSFGGTTNTYTFAGNPNESATNMRWDSYSFDVTASGTSTTLQITAGAGSNWAGGPMLDNVQVVSPSVYTSGANVTAYDPLPGGTDTNWGTDVCVNTPAISVDDPRWTNPHAAYPLGGHPWSGTINAPWINAWPSLSEAALPSAYPNGGFVHPTNTSPDYYNWSKYTTTVSGQGNYVLQLLADNCSWIYLDGKLAGVQGTDLSKHVYPVTLNGTETLTFVIFDGGGLAGGQFRLETYASYVAAGGDPNIIQPPPTNGPPTIAAQSAAVVVNEGATATNTGTVSDPDRDPVTLTASVGTVTNNGDGTWSWSYAATDGPAQSQAVTITADDGQGHKVPTSFTLTVNNVAPTVTAASAATINIGDTFTLNASFTDPGAADGPWTATIDWGDGSTPQTVSTTTTAISATHPYTKFGKFTISYTVADKDNGVSAPATTTVQVNDPTPPVITPTPSRVPDANGWYTSAVSISWSVVDPESGILAGSPTNCNVATVSSDTPPAGVTITCTAKNGGGVQGSGSITIKYDGSAPTLTPRIDGRLGNNGWYVSPVTVSWSANDPSSGAPAVPCPAGTISTDNAGATFPCKVTNGAGLSTTGAVSVMVDVTAPTVTYTGNAGTYTVDQTVNITCTAADAMSHVATTNCANVTGNAYDFTLGANNYSASATDNAGNVGQGSTSFTVQVTTGSLCSLVERFVSNAGVANSLCVKLQHGDYAPFQNELSAQSGKKISVQNAALLSSLADALAKQ